MGIVLQARRSDGICHQEAKGNFVLILGASEAMAAAADEGETGGMFEGQAQRVLRPIPIYIEPEDEATSARFAIRHPNLVLKGFQGLVTRLVTQFSRVMVGRVRLDSNHLSRTKFTSEDHKMTQPLHPEAVFCSLSLRQRI